MNTVRQGAVTFKGNPINLAGPELRAGEAAPDFKIQGQDLADITLASSAGKTRILFSVPSLDTGVCAKETKNFNDQVAQLPGVEVLCISMDLPFAQKRWCGAENVQNVKTASDHREGSFGHNYGVLISGGVLDRILTRAVFVVDGQGTLKYVQYVAEVTTEPDYAAVLAAAQG